MLLSISGYILSGVVGGLFAAILYPIFTHVVLRWYNKSKTKLSIDTVDRLNCRVTNNSCVTLKNVIVYVTINNTKDDILVSDEFQVFCSDKQIVEDRLSWSKNIEGRNLSEIDIHQGESQKLNLIRAHTINSKLALEIASEQGFYNKDLKNSSRAILTAKKNYVLKVKVVGDNLWPVEQTFTYTQLTSEITEI